MILHIYHNWLIVLAIQNVAYLLKCKIGKRFYGRKKNTTQQQQKNSVHNIHIPSVGYLLIFIDN